MLKARPKTIHDHEAKLKRDVKGLLRQVSGIELIQCMLKELVHGRLLLPLLHPLIDQLAPVTGIGCLGNTGSDSLKRMDHPGFLEDGQPPAPAIGPDQIQDGKELQDPGKTPDALLGSLGYKGRFPLLQSKEGNDFVMVAMFDDAEHNGR
jgi:hypothetical protein